MSAAALLLLALLLLLMHDERLPEATVAHATRHGWWYEVSCASARTAGWRAVAEIGRVVFWKG